LKGHKNRKHDPIGHKLHDIDCNRFSKLYKLTTEDSAGVIRSLLDNIRAKADTIEFCLVSCYESPLMRETEANSEVDPLLCLDVYLRSMMRSIVDIGAIAHIRAADIYDIRKRAKKKFLARTLGA